MKEMPFAKQKRFWTLVLAGLAVAAMILLAAGLPQLDLSPGRPLPRKKPTEAAPSIFGLPAETKTTGILFLLIFFGVQMLLPLALIYVVISSEARKRVLRSLSLLLWLLALFLVMRNRPQIFTQFQGAALPTFPADDAQIPDVEFVARPPEWLALAMSVGLALVVAAGIVVGAWYLWQRTRRPERVPLERLAEDAQRALDALETGADLKDTVMRCYAEMSQALREHRGLIRDADVTPREFEVLVQEAGLPGAQVRQLTRLFEAVRYGDRSADAAQERQAVTCLSAIVAASKGAS